MSILFGITILLYPSIKKVLAKYFDTAMFAKDFVKMNQENCFDFLSLRGRAPPCRIGIYFNFKDQHIKLIVNAYQNAEVE